MIDRDIAQKMRSEGATYREIGEKFGVSKQRVEQALSTQGKARKGQANIDKVKYQGLYDFLIGNPNITLTKFCVMSCGRADKNTLQRFWNMLHGKDTRVPLSQIKRMQEITNMTFEEMFKERKV